MLQPGAAVGWQGEVEGGEVVAELVGAARAEVVGDFWMTWATVWSWAERESVVTRVLAVGPFWRVHLPDSTPPATGLQAVTPRPSVSAIGSSSRSMSRCIVRL